MVNHVQMVHLYDHHRIHAINDEKSSALKTIVKN